MAEADDDAAGEVPYRKEFGSTGGVVAYVKTRVDDIEKVVIFSSDKALTFPGVTVAMLLKFGMAICYTNGDRELITKDDASALMSDGIFGRMRIRTEFV